MGKRKKNGKPIINMRIIFPATVPNVNAHNLNEIIFITRLKSVTSQRLFAHCLIIYLVRADVGAVFVCNFHSVKAQLWQVSQKWLKCFSAFRSFSLKCASVIPLNVVTVEDDGNDNEKKIENRENENKVVLIFSFKHKSQENKLRFDTV